MIKSKLWAMDIDELRATVARACTRTEALDYLGYKTSCGAQMQLFTRVCTARQVDTSHFKSRSLVLADQHRAQAAQVVAAWLADPDYIATVKGWQLSLKTPIHQWVLQRAGHKCEDCGWCRVNPFTKRIPIQIHHIDGDASHNRPENLRVLCPSCHSLTRNFGHRNKSTRIHRYAPQVKIA